MFKLAQGETDEHGLGLTPVGYSFVAGMLRHLPAITAVTAPTVNSYKVRANKTRSASDFRLLAPLPSFGWLSNGHCTYLRTALDRSRLQLGLHLGADLPVLGGQQPLEHAASESVGHGCCLCLSFWRDLFACLCALRCCCCCCVLASHTEGPPPFRSARAMAAAG
eukprot:COSAG01_NODE_5639_length_4125_cov_16.441288_5_plen_165_part_00